MRFNETEYTSPGQMDFVPRERRSDIWKTLVAWGIAIVLVFLLARLPESNEGRTLAAFLSVAVVTGLAFYFIYRKQQNLDLVMATEYQNMLFSQAVALGSEFTLFVRRDGTITYSDSGLKDIFPNARYGDFQALETVFEQGGVPKTDRDRILASIANGKRDRIVFPLQRDGETLEYIVTTEPLPRPAGYSLLRGRQYQGQRSGAQAMPAVQNMPEALHSTGADRLEHLLASSPAGFYTTDHAGRLEYVNPALEQWLGYEAGDLTGTHTPLHRIFYQMAGRPVPDNYRLAQFEGEVLLQKRQGSLFAASLKQTLMRDDQGNITGATGTLLPAPDPRA